MTEPEAQELAKRLTRIWTLPQLLVQCPLWTWEEGEFAFSVEVASHVRFACEYDPPLSVQLIFSLTRSEGDNITGGIYCYSAVGRINMINLNTYGRLEMFEQFAEEWMPFFRRGCWLSGCDIEATAHEKAEWMQGFTKEEIEAWELEM